MKFQEYIGEANKKQIEAFLDKIESSSTQIFESLEKAANAIEAELKRQEQAVPQIKGQKLKIRQLQQEFRKRVNSLRTFAGRLQ
jgi:IS30 family transposase